MKKLLSIMLAVLIAVSMLAFVACGDNEPTDPPGTKTFVFEAEGVDLSEQSGHGWSNNANGCQMIQGKNTASIRANTAVMNSISNEYFVGYFGVVDTELVFEITADAADTQCTLILQLASEWGTMTIDQSVMKIEVNGKNIDYTEFDVAAKKIGGASEVEYGIPFAEFRITPTISLNAGTNVIKLIAQGKGYDGSDAFDIGPGVDYIKIKSMSNLSWESLWEDNLLNVKYDD